ncbi:MAG: hypothetical protein FJW40_07060 [Acidobacteria bacterium]|nr:hypothetical protein [Acidobacteriota bacterium]
MSDHSTDRQLLEAWEESAAMAALRLATPADTASAPPALIAEFTETASLLADTVVPVPPAPSLRARLMTQVADFENLKPVADVRRFDGEWSDTGLPGVDVRFLYKDRSTGLSTVLLRMAPGASYPSHHHHNEQCLVIEGDIRFGEVVYRKGDFVVAGKETTHPTIHTAEGNILLLVVGHNEFVQA